jgi:hypothetical protein
MKIYYLHLIFNFVLGKQMRFLHSHEKFSRSCSAAVRNNEGRVMGIFRARGEDLWRLKLP